MAKLQEIRGMVEFFYQFPPSYPSREEFRHNLVYGRLCKLFTVKNIDKFGVAAQSVAGGRLRNVVVETHLISRDLLGYKASRGHETYIPLNKISSRVIDKRIVDKIKNLSNNKARLAIEVISYD